MEPPLPRAIELVGERAYGWTLHEDAGRQVERVVRIPQYVRDTVVTHRTEFSSEAVIRAFDTPGESVIIDRRSHRGDASMDWVVQFNDMVPRRA